MVCLNGAGLCALDDRILLLYNGGELVVENGELGEGLLNALKLAVTCADIAQDGACVTSAIRAKLEAELRQWVLYLTHGHKATVELTAVWKTPSSPQSAWVASLTSSSEASGFTILY